MGLIIGLGFLGLLCLYLEFFVPGGILVGLGALMLVGSAIGFSWMYPDEAFFYVFALVIMSGVVCYLAIWHLKKSGRRNSFFLAKTEEGLSSDKLMSTLVGKKGLVVTELKPSGHVRLEERVYQATSQGEYLPQGTLVEVLQVSGAHVIVKKGE